MDSKPIKEVTIDFATGKVFEGPPQGERILAMPMKRNMPNGQEGFKEVDCPHCGKPCWERPLPEGFQDIPRMCTECSLKVTAERIKNQNERNNS